MIFCLAACLLVSAACARREPVFLKGEDYEVHFSRRSDIPARLVELIGEAEEEVLVATYGINLESVLRALEESAGRGVRTAVLADARRREALELFDLPEIYPAGQTAGLVHAKFGVIDRRKAWIGSFNLTFNSAYLHDDDLVVIKNRSLAVFLAEAFESLAAAETPGTGAWHGKIGQKPASVFFNPACRPALLESIGKAKKEIFFSLYLMTDREIKEALALKASAETRVKGILERSVHYNPATFEKLEEAGGEIAWSRNHHLNHHKAFVFDREKVITGSYNPTAGARANQEVSLRLEHPGIAAYYRSNLSQRRF